jgi:N-acetylglutamate synthase-like GNAT family acetyltransferase
VAQQDTEVFVRLERFYDAVPRPDARAEEFGGLVLFIREGPGWPFYARPRPGAEAPSAADVTAVRQRQRELGVPEAFEWVHDTNPELLAVARSAGLEVLLAPLLVLDPAALVPDLPVAGAAIRLLDADSDGFAADLAASRAVAQLGFGMPAAAAPTPTINDALVAEVAGPAERDALPAPDEALVEAAREKTAAGRIATAVVESPAEGILASGLYQRVGDVAEIAGVATLPAVRRRGYASQLTATLARKAVADGVGTVFLSAGDDDIARLYSRVGFRRVGTACIAEPPALLGGLPIGG